MRQFLAAALALLACCALLAAQEVGWPQEILTDQTSILIYQPQVESLEGDRLRYRAAVSVARPNETERVFGAVWIEGKLSTDRDARIATLFDIRVSDVRFAEISDEQRQLFSQIVDDAIARWDGEISLDRLLTSLEAASQQEVMAEGLNTDPPAIVVVDHPTVLIPLDGDPVLRSIDETSLMRVVNTPYLMVFDSQSKGYLLNAGEIWYSAPEIQGPWERESNPPKEAAELVPPEALEAAEIEKARDDFRMPRIIVATEPTELIVTAGEPSYTPLAGNDLLFVSNTESDLILEIASQQHYLLLSGRWFRSKSLQGPWSYVAADELPESFGLISAESDKAHLRAHVAGTQEAEDAVMDAMIPQTTAVRRSEASLDVEYDGQPKFEPVEGVQEMQYATNTASSVLKIGDFYYVCEQGVWFTSYSAEGPWDVADSVPQQVQQIPPSNPNHNVKYVYVYDSTPEVVYVGYTSAYVGCYPYHGSVVYGTGFHYPPYVGPQHYYPRSWTFGFSVRYNPWTGGWGFGFSTNYGGFNFSFGWGSGWYGGPWWGPRPGWWGPAGYRAGYRHGVRAGYWAGRASGRPRPIPYGVGNPRIHSRQGLARTQPVNFDRQGVRDNIYSRPENRARVADRAARTDRVRSAQPRQSIQNNVYADRDGNVFRQTNRGWEKRESGGWRQGEPPRTRDRAPGAVGTRPATPATRPGTLPAPRPATRPATQPATRPATRPATPTTRQRSSPSPSRLDRESAARQRGTTRTQNYNRSRPSGAAVRGGGARRRR